MTNASITLDIFDLTAKGDAALAHDGVLMPFAEPLDLLGELPEWPAWASLEPGRFVLDGNAAPYPDDLGSVKWAVHGGALSGEDGALARPVVLEYEFGAPHSCLGLTLHFDEAGGGWATDVLAQWFAGEVEVCRMRVSPTSPVWLLQKRVQRFDGLRLTLYATNRPLRYLRLAGVEFGVQRHFGPGELLEATAVEECDPTCTTLPAGSLEWRVAAGAGDFALLQPHTLLEGLQQRQRVRATVQQNGESLPFGTWYLTEWCAEDELLARFSATDVIGLLADAAHPGGMYNTTAGELAAEILAGYDFTMEEELAALPIGGWLPTGTRREALAQLCFAIGCTAHAGRDGFIRLYRPGSAPTASLGYGRKVAGSSELALQQPVSAVAVAGHSYAEGDAEERLFFGTLAAGRHHINLASPASGLRCEGALLVEHGPNHAVLWLESGGEAALYGKRYARGSTNVQLENELCPPSAPQNLVEVAEATLLSPAGAKQAAARLLAAKQKQYLQALRTVLQSEGLGDAVQVASFSAGQLRGNITRMETDLAAGLMCNMQVLCDKLDARFAHYCGELWASGGGVV